MAVFRVEKKKDYTVMSNWHLRDKDLSLKAKGMLSLMLSLPEDWDYTLAGLAYVCKDGIASIRTTILELEESGYLSRRRLRNEKGYLGDTEYTIHEKPQKCEESVDNSVENSPIFEKPIFENQILDNPILDTPTLGNPIYENRTQLNTNTSSKQESNTDVSNIHQSIRDDATEKPDEMESMDIYSQILKENIEYGYLCEQHRYKVEQIDELFELMLEAVCSTKKTIRIGGEDKPTEVVKSRILKLNQFHIEYVLDALSKNTTEVRNIRSYMLTTLYNAPATIDNYYKAMVNHDLYGDK